MANQGTHRKHQDYPDVQTPPSACTQATRRWWDQWKSLSASPSAKSFAPVSPSVKPFRTTSTTEIRTLSKHTPSITDACSTRPQTRRAVMAPATTLTYTSNVRGAKGRARDAHPSSSAAPCTLSYRACIMFTHLLRAEVKQRGGRGRAAAVPACLFVGSIPQHQHQWDLSVAAHTVF